MKRNSLRLYRDATQWVSVLIWPVAGTMAFFAEPLLLAWTNNTVIAHKAAPILFWYVLGNACLGLVTFQFSMQYAHGKLRLHALGSVMFITILIPGMIWASLCYGAKGAGFLWFASNLLSIFIWTWIVHHRFAPGLHWRWLRQDVMPIALSTLFVLWMLSHLTLWTSNRLILIGQLMLFGMLSLLPAILSSPVILAGVRQIFATKVDSSAQQN